MALFLWSGGREARLRTANPATRVQIPSRPQVQNDTRNCEGVMELEKSERPWGRYEVLQEGAHHKTKCIWVYPGKRLSYQRHQKRAEHWFIVSGSAEVTLNGVVTKHSAGESISVGIGDLHRIGNIGTDDVIFVEVQTGTYFGEDDIERIEDDFGR